MGVTEELAGYDVVIGLNEAEVLSVESVLEPMEGLPTVMPLVSA